MWEHAYYLQYKNVKKDWVEAFWNLVNWPDVAARFERVKSLHARLITGRPDARTRPGANRHPHARFG